MLVPVSPFTHLVNTDSGAVPVFCWSAMIVLHAVMAVDFLLDGFSPTRAGDHHNSCDWPIRAKL